jgi:HEAT repeat protein
MSIEAMKQALEALESDNPDIQLRAAIALRQELAMSKPPTKIFGPSLEEILNSAGFYRKREWVGLTDDEVTQAMYKTDAIFTGPMQFRFAKEIEAKLKEKNT